MPVIVKVAGPFGVCGFGVPEHPAKAMSTSTAAIASRRRGRRAHRREINSISARTIGTSGRAGEVGVGTRVGGTKPAVVVIDTCA